MSLEKIQRFLALLDEIVNEDGGFNEKRDQILNQASENDKINLSEFAAWFE